MRAGKLRSKIDLLERVKGQDPAGGIIDEWLPFATSVRCDDRVISSRDNLRNGVELAQETHTIELRYRNDVTTEHRVRLQDGRTLKIEGPPKPGDDQKKRSMIITAVFDGKQV